MHTVIHDQPINALQILLCRDPKLFRLLELSLGAAKRNAIAQGLQILNDFSDPILWPTSIPDYIGYLTRFVRWAPTETDASLGDKEVYDRLCHFYWLVDQEVSIEGGPPQRVQNIAEFASWLVTFASAWGSFLDTTESFSAGALQSFMKAPKYHVDDSMITGADGVKRPNNPSGWKTFNQFFARELNPGLRPIADPDDPKAITAPADATFKESFPISPEDRVTFKLTHRYSVGQLLDGSPYADDFAGGLFAHSFLGPYDYHRFHAPVAGRVLESRAIRGRVYLAVEVVDGQFSAPDSAQDGYEFRQSRGLIIFDSSIGKVAVLPIGMSHVSSVNMLAGEGADLAKGEEFGYFLFGGSDIVLLFQKRSAVTLSMQEGVHYDYGTRIGTASG